MTGKKRPNPKVERVAFILAPILIVLIFVGYPLAENYRFNHPVDKQCTVISAELSKSSSGTGGISTSGTEVKVNTTDCGTVYIDDAVAPQKGRQEMADELNQHQEQKVTLIFPPFQWPGTKDTVLTGYGYRL